jgi:putative ABC transport system permease protein
MNAARRRFFDRFPLPLRFAARDLSGDPRGFAIFIACIIIGVAAISGVSGLASALATGVAREGRTILGGDASFALPHRRLTAEERAFFESRGRVDEIAQMRAMARRGDGETALIEIKAIEAGYPLVGAPETQPEGELGGFLREDGGRFGLVADPLLAARLDLKAGDVVSIGDAQFTLRAELRSEPDKLGGGLGFGPRVLMSRAALEATGLATPGAIVRHTARIALAPSATNADVSGLVADAARAFPLAGWEARTRSAVSPQFTRNLDRFAQLLTLVALTALVAGGAGVANAVIGLIERKRVAFAIYKALGAPGSRVFAIALSQVMFVAALAILLGLALGALLPPVAAEALRRASELPVVAAFDPASLWRGALYGALVTLAFSIGPLGRAHDAPVAALLRETDEESARPARLRYRLAGAASALALLATLLVASSDKKLALAYIGAALAAFALLRGVAFLVVLAARRLPRAGDARLRLAQSNIHRPRSLAAALIVSIGLTQTLLVALALVEGAIHLDFARADAGKVPRFYFIDTPKRDVDAFAALLKREAPDARISHVPMMRGRIVAVKGVRAEKLRVADDVAWALEGDRGVTFAAAPPENSTISQGEWWAKDYAGPPLVSLESKVAEGLGLVPGDEITVNVLGREIAARVANLRRLDWRGLAINFVMVFTPNAFRDAPYTELFTIGYEGADADARDARIARASAKAFPLIAAIRVKDALEAVDKIASQLALAARSAAGVAVLTAILALASAVAAGQRARRHDAVVLKTLGATRAWLTGAYAMEFALLGAVASLIALIAGTAAAYAMTEWLMKIDFVFLPGTVAATALTALIATIALGLLGSWRALNRTPARELREL